MRKKSFTKGKAVFIVDLILIPVFTFVLYSGLKLHVAGHKYNHAIWVYWAYHHSIAGVLSLVFGGLHIMAHKVWYRNLLKKGIGKRSRVVAMLSVLFLLEIITGLILVFFIEGGNSAVGFWHYRLGLLMTVCLLMHLISRFSTLVKGLRRT